MIVGEVVGRLAGSVNCKGDTHKKNLNTAWCVLLKDVCSNDRVAAAVRNSGSYAGHTAKSLNSLRNDKSADSFSPQRKREESIDSVLVQTVSKLHLAQNNTRTPQLLQPCEPSTWNPVPNPESPLWTTGWLRDFKAPISEESSDVGHGNAKRLMVLILQLIGQHVDHKELASHTKKCIDVGRKVDGIGQLPFSVADT
eukprot:Lankesteria_metandrocarpae@DN7301_c0_g1_i1.p1